MDYSKIGALLRTLRLEKGMTQAMLAEKLHLMPKIISKWERGHGLLIWYAKDTGLLYQPL